MSKVICPLHTDTNPSMEVYEDGRGWCFVCNRAYQFSDTEQKTLPKIISLTAQEVEERCLDILANVPKTIYRGLNLPCDPNGAYIVWPDDEYYKQRLFDGSIRYLCPKGVKQPLLILNEGKDRLLIVEGEFNALSLAKALPDWKIVCPGGSGGFKTHKVELCDLADKAKQTLAWVDEDSAGAMAILYIFQMYANRDDKTRRRLMSEVVNGKKQDANEILCTKGPAALKEMVEEFMRRF